MGQEIHPVMVGIVAGIEEATDDGSRRILLVLARKYPVQSVNQALSHEREGETMPDT